MQWYDSNRDYINEYIEQWNRTAHKAKVGLIALGIVLALSGIAALVAPLGAYVFIQSLIAALLIVHGIGQIATYVQTPEFFRNGVQLATGILNALLGALLLMLPASFMAGAIVYLLSFLLIMTGIAFLFMPLISSLVLSYLLGAYLIVGGITLVVEGIAIKKIER